MGYRAGVGLGTIMPVSVQALGCADYFASSYASILNGATKTVLVFLTLLSTGLHYVIQRLNYKRDLARVEHILSQAKQAAWGPKMVPTGGRRKVRLLCQCMKYSLFTRRIGQGEFRRKRPSR
jgi:hypothetical protein